MAAKKTTAKKAPAKKKAVAKKAPAKKVPAKKKAAKKITKPKFTPEQVYSMIEQAAYFAALNDGFSQDPSLYWTQAEAQVNSMIKG